MLLLMRFPASSQLLSALAITCMAASSYGAQEEDAPLTDPDVDRLVDEAWDATGVRHPAGESVGGDVLELSLEAARAIGLTNDLGLQGAQEIVEAARFRELGSWGAFDWLFSASGSLNEAESDASNIFDADTGTIDSSTQELSFGFERAFTSGSQIQVTFSHNNTRTNSFFNLYDTVNADVLTAVYTRPLMRGSGEEYATSLQEAADLRWQREQEGYRHARQQLLVQIEVQYWGLVLAEQQLVVAGSALDLALDQLDRDRRRREAGVATEVEVIQDEATVARRIEGVLFAQTAARSSMDRLRSTLFPGIEGETWDVRLKAITPLPNTTEAPETSDWDAEIQSALEQRSDVRMSKLDVDIAELYHQRAISEKAPFLDLLFQVSSHGYDESVGESLEESLTYDYPSLTAGLNFQLPMQNTALENEERATRAELRAAHLMLESASSSVAAELREALREVRYQVEAARAASKSREAAQRLMMAEKSRYEQGLATNFQVLEFQQALVEAQYSEHAAQAAFGKALAILSGVRGSVGEPQRAEAP